MADGPAGLHPRRADRRRRHRRGARGQRRAGAEARGGTRPGLPPAAARRARRRRAPLLSAGAVTPEEARRIAVRAQLLDGSATSVLDTVRHLGFLQMDPISTVAPPQHLVLFSRLGRFDTAELDRLIWEERKLFEWNAFIWPVEDLPLVRARMRRYRATGNAWARDFLQANTRFRRYLLRELERNGPLLSRDLKADLLPESDPHRWWGTRQVRLMLELLEASGEIAV